MKNPYLLPQFIKQASKTAWEQTVARWGGKVSSDYERSIKRRIRQQTELSWAALNPDYLEYKRKNKLDTRKLIATGAYVRSINSRQTSKDSWVVDVPNRKHRPSNLTFRQLARIHEFGSITKNIPARPHWAPTTHEIKRRVPEYSHKIEKEFTSATQSKVRRLIEG